ncbi:MAG: recombination protein RecR, partial [uncultured bacterium]
MLPTNIQNLIQEFSKLPGIGPKSAERLVFYLLKTKQESLEEFSGSVKNLKKYIKNCSVCNNFTEKDPCLICSDKNRDGSVICVVSEPLDVV